MFHLGGGGQPPRFQLITPEPRALLNQLEGCLLWRGVYLIYSTPLKVLSLGVFSYQESIELLGQCRADKSSTPVGDNSVKPDSHPGPYLPRLKERGTEGVLIVNQPLVISETL